MENEERSKKEIGKQKTFNFYAVLLSSFHTLKKILRRKKGDRGTAQKKI